MNSFQTTKGTVHYRRNYGNHGPLCSNPTDQVDLAAYSSSDVPEIVTCKDCIKRFKTIGITPGKVRKLTPKHLGRLSEEERRAQDAGTKIHAVRDLREMIDAETPDFLTPDTAIKVFKHWLRDCAHDRRVKNELDEQAVIERLIEML